MSPPRQAMLLLACVAAAAPVAARGGEPLLVGGSENVWLIRPGAPGSFDLVVRAGGQKWQWAQNGVPGTPAAAAAVGSRLHVLLSPNGYLIFEAPPAATQSVGRKCKHRFWPARGGPVAVCAAAGLEGAGENSIVALVPRSAGPTTRPGAPASRPARGAEAGKPSSRPARLVRLGVFLNTAGEWKHLDDLDGVALGPAARVLAGVFDGTLYVAVCPGANRSNRLAAWRNGQWREIALVDPAAGAPILALVHRPDGPAMVVAPAADEPGHRQVHLVALDARTPAPAGPPQPVTRDGEIVAWDESDLPQAARLADRLAMLWHEGDALKFALCDPATGQLQPAETVGIFDRRPPEGDAAQNIIEYFVWTLLGLTLLAMFVLRPRTRPQAFVLPPEVRPARLLRRLAAGLIDLLPFAFIATLVFSPPPEILEQARDFDSFMEAVGEMQQLEASAFGMILTIVTYILYCIVMEYRLGATLGKRLFRLRVVGNEGVRPGLREVILRNLLKAIELMPPQILLLFPLINRNRQRLGDLFAQTAVVEQAEVAPPEPTGDGPTDEPPPPGQGG